MNGMIFDLWKNVLGIKEKTVKRVKVGNVVTKNKKIKLKQNAKNLNLLVFAAEPLIFYEIYYVNNFSWQDSKKCFFNSN